MNFIKMSGAGNDFIMVDNRDGSLDDLLSPALIASICRRGLSVGADGLIELVNSKEHAFRMRYYNSDGGEADMCGNGARCISRFACELGVVAYGDDFTFQSRAGVHRARVIDENESVVWITDPVIHFTQREMDSEIPFRAGLADTGVPHCVVFHGNLHDGTFERYAGLLRNRTCFGNNGANVNWVRVETDGSLAIRTFERGVEGETLACGTGAMASAILAERTLDSVTFPVRILVKSGLFLTAGRDSSGYWLSGEARIVYRGEALNI
jgi:diaminopimelate epimerase